MNCSGAEITNFTKLSEISWWFI